jgi:hypothetical protein
MRRSLAGLLLACAFACASVSIGGWLMQRTAFNPDRTADLAGVVLDDPALRKEITDVIVNSAARLTTDPAALRNTVDTVIAIPAGEALVGEILHDAHAHLIGEQTTPVQITPDQMVEIIRDQRAASLPPVTIEVPRVGVLAVIDDALRWLVPLAGGAAFVLLALAFLAHPERGEIARALGFGLLFLAVLAAVMGYVLPRYIVPLLVDGAWEAIPMRLADHGRTTLIALEIVLVAAGLAMFAWSGVSQRRRRFNTPVNTYRYNEDRRWS